MKGWDKQTLAGCFGSEVSKLLKTIKSENDIIIRTAPWYSHWFQFDADGALDAIRFYYRPGYKFYPMTPPWWVQHYYVDGDPLNMLLPQYDLVHIQIKMRYYKTGKWYTFSFSRGINYPHPGMEAKIKAKMQPPPEETFYEYKWLEPWP